jgi:transcription elongation GreA/GreB family factor/very-short-patch-repair endonuclease
MSEESIYSEEDARQLVGEVFSGRLGIGEALTKLRTRLLDLTMRNRLLNFRLSKARNYQFTNDPDLDLLFERLDEGKVIPLAYVPDPPHARYENGKKPDVRVYARECSIGTSVDLGKPTQARRHTDLQVVAYPSDLERSARKISTEARTVVEETGTNMLYLVFGFLEYYDSDDSEQAVQAPVLSMPVTLTKGDLDPDTRTYRYNLAYSGDDIAENFTLREKLRQQFRLELPELDEADTPETYLQKIKTAVSKRRRWTVRRQLTLAFLSFGKLAIWADLDPERAPALLKSPLLADIFKGGTAAGGSGFHAEDYAIDAHQRADLPLIYDADSSQHSALIDVLDGKSLVINGPPGTGKSQTITNIVATAMAEGKKILFVSEKMAALNVVKQRLENVGLGDFCLELHSNKTQKKQLLENIERRINKRFSSPSAYERQLEVLRERKATLNAYAQLQGSKVANRLDMTVHEVFWAVELRRHDLGTGVQEFAGLVFDGATGWTPDVLDRWRQVFRSIQSSIQDMGMAPDSCAWRGFSPELLLPGDEEPVLRTAQAALEHATDLVGHAHDLEDALGLPELTIEQLQETASEQATLDAMPPQLDGGMLAQLCGGDVAHVDAATRCVSAVRLALHEAQQARSKAAPALVDMSRPDAQALVRSDVQRSNVFSEAGRNLSIRELSHRSPSLAQLIADARGQLPDDALVPEQPEAVAAHLRDQNANPALAFALELAGGQLAARARDALAGVREKDQALTQLDATLRRSAVSFGGSVGELRKILDGTSIPELQPQATVDDVVIDTLGLYAAQGFGDWTAERFDAVAREGQATVSEAKGAAEELTVFFGRLNLPVEQTASWLQSLETLITVCEQAPSELLGLRGPGLERADFVEIAKGAEERHQGLAAQEQRVSATFYLDTLPAEAQIREHLAVARRGDSFFNFLRSDWRRAKASFRGCYRGQDKFSALTMAENFAAVTSWREATAAYESDPQLAGTLGALFEGRKTDYSRVRRLSSWLASASQALAGSDFSFTVKALTLPQEQIAAIKATAGKLRQAAVHVQAFGKLIPQLPGLDQAVAIGRKWDLAYAPVEKHFEHLKEGSQKLRLVVRSTVSVNRAIALAQLRMNLQTHRPLVEDLIAAPKLLADLAGTLGLPVQSLAYEHLPGGIEAIAKRAEMVEELASCVQQLGEHLTPKQAMAVLEGVQRLAAQAAWLRGQAGGCLLRDYLNSLEQDRASADGVLAFVDGKVNVAESLDSGMTALLQLSECETILDTVGSREDVKASLGVFYRRLDTPADDLLVCVEWAQAVQKASKKLPQGAAAALLKADAAGCAKRAARALASATQSYRAYEEQISFLVSFGTLDWAAWGGMPRPQDAVDRLQLALAGAGQLVPWSKYLSGKEECVEAGLDKALVPFEAAALPASVVVTAFEYVFFRSLARAILSRHRELGRFTGTSHENLRSEFAELDKELIRLNGLLHAAKIDRSKRVPSGVASGRAADLTEMSLLTREISKQKRHIPIRQLLKRAGKSLQQLKPCFMMGPLSVAQYLEQGHLQFDLVVMDEASQLRPEDALGAIARGKQLVVVGDPKQLPPTNFFDRLMEDDDDEGEQGSAVVEGVESILGVCEHLYRPVRTLRWHYRSQHESLIAFSNSQFYEGRLVVFPAPVKRNSSLGVNHRFVKEGVYVDRRNIPEAERVVDAVLEHMKQCRTESLGVVTLNQTQRELIDDIFEKRSKGNPAVAEFLDFHKKAGWEFFVKNLENVQGDERDVIYISTTFGRPPGTNVVRKNFGPINRPDGWRRLNVLFTRARRRLELFTSLRSSDVMSPEERVSLGRKALHDYLVFAKTGLLPAVAGQRSGKDPDSDFEIAVARALEQAGFEVEPQVGVAGYFIDIGVKHASRPGEYLAAIECDGATYHSSLSARDRDRIRQQILESLGWEGRIIRVWSTDWFADPHGQIRRLTDFLHDRLAQTSPLAYVEEVSAEEDEDTAATYRAELPNDVAPIKVRQPEQATSAESELLVEVGDLVTYAVHTPSGEEQLTVQIVDTVSNPRMNLVNESSPLAQVLIGLCSGDESQLVVQGHAPKRVRVVSIKRPGFGGALVQ